MRVLINVNEQISAAMIGRHFQAGSLNAEVTAAPNEKMLEKMQTCGYDLVAFYTDAVENNALISFFNAAGNKRKILFVKKQNLTRVNEALESIVDECFAVPIDFVDFMLRIRRMFRDEEQKSVEPPVSEQQAKPAEREQPLPIHRDRGPKSAALAQEVAVEPVKADITNNVQNILPQPDQGEKITDLRPAEIAPIKNNEVQPAAITPAQKKKSAGKKKSPLRYLNKTELLEIILEQEKIISEMNSETEQMKRELDKRHIILKEAGSIAEASLKLNGVFEAAQKSADQYLDSVKAVNAHK